MKIGIKEKHYDVITTKKNIYVISEKPFSSEISMYD